ncbi:MAG: HAMP domain-containing histidine kinase [Gammaproteobacteria bacterium]|nr:HAMP domain-containing histidine kinase [Gammaproteobacteria bacterium]
MTQPMNSDQGMQSIQPHNDHVFKQYRSLRFYLIVCFSGLIIVIGTLTALGVYHSTRKEALALQDHHLELIAQVMSQYHYNIVPNYTDGPEIKSSNHIPTDPNQQEALIQTDHATELQEAQIVIQPISFIPNKTELHWLQTPPSINNGLSTIKSHGEEWRVFVSTSSMGQRFVVGQRTEVRDELAENTSLRMLIPLVILLPILILAITLITRQSFKPIAELATHIDQQGERTLLPLDDFKIPREILPFVYSINQLLTRLFKNMEQQRRFIADAAHELRTPLTALTLQAENLNHAKLSTEDAERVHRLQGGLIRSQNLLEQLLNLARQQSGSMGAKTQISLLATLKELLVDFLPLAAQKNIDLGVLQQEDIWVNAAVQDIQMLLRNAISNAIRYTPMGGQIDIRIYAQAEFACIEITDTGMGIPETELSRVFDPFYRVLGQLEAGSGLGLTIIQEIAQRYHGRVTLRNLEQNSGHPSGLCFEFQMPLG